jgi:hypothetical protein
VAKKQLPTTLQKNELDFTYSQRPLVKTITRLISSIFLAYLKYGFEEVKQINTQKMLFERNECKAGRVLNSQRRLVSGLSSILMIPAKASGQDSTGNLFSRAKKALLNLYSSQHSSILTNNQDWLNLKTQLTLPLARQLKLKVFNEKMHVLTNPLNVKVVPNLFVLLDSCGSQKTACAIYTLRLLLLQAGSA